MNYLISNHHFLIPVPLVFSSFSTLARFWCNQQYPPHIAFQQTISFPLNFPLFCNFPDTENVRVYCTKLCPRTFFHIVNSFWFTIKFLYGKFRYNHSKVDISRFDWAHNSRKNVHVACKKLPHSGNKTRRTLCHTDIVDNRKCDTFKVDGNCKLCEEELELDPLSTRSRCEPANCYYRGTSAQPWEWLIK